jgi:hypothetical protein
LPKLPKLKTKELPASVASGFSSGFALVFAVVFQIIHLPSYPLTQSPALSASSAYSVSKVLIFAFAVISALTSVASFASFAVKGLPRFDRGAAITLKLQGLPVVSVPACQSKP